MKIAWLHSFPPQRRNGGVFMHELVDSVKGLGYDVELIYTGNLASWRAAGEIARVRRHALSADIVHAQYGSGCGAVGSFLPRPRILTLRGSDWYGMPASIRGLRGRLAPLLSRAVLERYDHLCVVSERMRREVGRYVDDTRVSVIPSGVDLARFVPRARSTARRTLGAGDDERPWVLFSTVASRNVVKRPELARAVMTIVNATRPEVQLKVMHAVPREQVPSFVSACDVILLTSIHEGWPNIVKEGLAANVPFVSTDVGDLRDIADVEPNCIVGPADPEALAAGILRVLAHQPSDRLRGHVEAMGLDATARRLTALYDRLA